MRASTSPARCWPWTAARPASSPVDEGTEMTEAATPESTSAQHRVDPRALDDYLRRHVEGYRGPLALKPLTGGQSNPTFLVTAGHARYVLRKRPAGDLLPSAHAVGRGQRVMQAVRGSGGAGPARLCLCGDPAALGTGFFVISHVGGRRVL